VYTAFRRSSLYTAAEDPQLLESGKSGSARIRRKIQRILTILSKVSQEELRCITVKETEVSASGKRCRLFTSEKKKRLKELSTQTLALPTCHGGTGVQHQ
jgi:hypothetical protein